MSTTKHRFHIAGLEVDLSITGDTGDLAGFYDQYPARGIAPGLVIEVERVADFARGRTRGPAYPAFDTALTAPGQIALSRFDAEGWIAIPQQDEGATPPAAPVRARFRVGESPNSLEAIIRAGMSIALPRLGALILHASSIATSHGQRPDETSKTVRSQAAVRGAVGPPPGGRSPRTGGTASRQPPPGAPKVGNRALVFAGKSGAGKSTIAAILAGAGFPKLADELLVVSPAATPEDPTWHAHVAPFLGSQGLPHGTRVPLAGIHFLVQAPDHQRTPLPRADALRELLRHVLVYVAEPRTAARVLAAAADLVAAVPCHRLAFAPDAGVARVLGIT